MEPSPTLISEESSTSTSLIEPNCRWRQLMAFALHSLKISGYSHRGGGVLGILGHADASVPDDPQVVEAQLLQVCVLVDDEGVVLDKVVAADDPQVGEEPLE